MPPAEDAPPVEVPLLPPGVGPLVAPPVMEPPEVVPGVAAPEDIVLGPVVLGVVVPGVVAPGDVPGVLGEVALGMVPVVPEPVVPAVVEGFASVAGDGLSVVELPVDGLVEGTSPVVEAVVLVVAPAVSAVFALSEPFPQPMARAAIMARAAGRIVSFMRLS